MRSKKGQLGLASTRWLEGARSLGLVCIMRSNISLAVEVVPTTVQYR
jgi:hypothetical protein